jgi:hypothetical protein
MSKRRRQLVDLGGDENEGGGPAGGGAAIGFNYDSEDPIAAAIARRAAKEKKCALGGLLGAYVDDDDEEEETDGASKEPPHPWKKLRDATTGHDYYWNQDDGSVSWTLPSAGDAKKAAERDSGDAGDDAQVAELKIPIPKPDVRTFADLLLSQADEVSGLREAIDETPALVRLVMDIERRVDDYERIKSGGNAETSSSAQDAALDALREAEKALPGAAEAFKARRAKAAAAEVARRVAAARAAKPASTKGKLAGVGRGADTDADAPPPPPPDEDEDAPPPPPPKHVIAAGPVIKETSAPLVGVKQHRVKQHQNTTQPPPPPARIMSKRPAPSEIDRWNRATAEREAGERRAEAARTAAVTDPTQMAARRAHEVERWKESATRAGGAGGDNPNFTPTVGDWRERAAAARKRRERTDAEASSELGESSIGVTRNIHPSSTAAASVTTTAAADAAAAAAGVDLSAISASLPQGWRAFYEASSGEVYYGDAASGETTWERPV